MGRFSPSFLTKPKRVLSSPLLEAPPEYPTPPQHPTSTPATRLGPTCQHQVSLESLPCQECSFLRASASLTSRQLPAREGAAGPRGYAVGKDMGIPQSLSAWPPPELGARGRSRGSFRTQPLGVTCTFTLSWLKPHGGNGKLARVGVTS